MAGAQAYILEIVKGKTSLGLRVSAAFYTQTRQAMEPGWVNDKHIRYQVRVTLKYLVSRLPQDVDMEALQKVLDKFGWNTLPLRQLGRAARIMGTEKTIKVGGILALTSPYKARPQ